MSRAQVWDGTQWVDISCSDMSNLDDEFLRIDGANKMLGMLRSAPDGPNERIRLEADGVDDRPFIAIHGGSDGSRQGYLGYPGTDDSGWNVIADKGNLGIAAMNGDVLIQSQEVLFTQRGRTSVTLVSGQAVVSFPIAFPSPPSVTAQVVLATSIQQTQHLDSITATGFTIDVWRGGSPDAGSRSISWIAVGDHP